MFFFAGAVLMFLNAPVSADKGKKPGENINEASSTPAKIFPLTGPTTPSPKVLPKNWPIHPSPKYVKNPPGFCVPTWRCEPASPTEPKPGKGPKYGKGPDKG